VLIATIDPSNFFHNLFGSFLQHAAREVNVEDMHRLVDELAGSSQQPRRGTDPLHSHPCTNNRVPSPGAPHTDQQQASNVPSVHGGSVIP